MLKKTRQVLKNQRGVTLIELLAVVIILGIIAAIAAPAILSNFDDAKANSDKQTKAIIEEAANRFVMDVMKDSKKNDIDLTTPTDDLNGPVTINSITYSTFLEDYLSNLSTNGVIVSAEESGKNFFVSITDGKVTVTTDTAQTTP